MRLSARCVSWSAGSADILKDVSLAVETGEFLGIAPTGRKIRVAGMSLDHLNDGVLVSGFDGWDNLGLRQQLGALPSE